MSAYINKYQIEFDDIIQDEFNDYRVEIHKKYDDYAIPLFNQNINHNIDSGMTKGGGNFSVMARFYLSDVDQDDLGGSEIVIFGNQSTSGSKGFRLYIDDTISTSTFKYLNLDYSDGSTNNTISSSPIAVRTEQFVTVVATFNVATDEVFLYTRAINVSNGNTVTNDASSNTQNVDLDSTTNVKFFGADSATNNNPTGHLFEVGIWDSILSSANADSINNSSNYANGVGNTVDSANIALYRRVYDLDVGDNPFADNFSDGASITVTLGGTTATITDYYPTSSADASSILIGTGDPCVLKYNCTADDILHALRTSYVDISFYQENDSDDYTELYVAEDDAFKVFIYKNDNLFWQGWIASQMFSEPFQSAPFPITLRAYDGLHFLKNINYFDDLDVFQQSSNLYNDRYGYKEIYKIIEKCIYNTGVRNSIYYQIHLKNENTSNAYYLFVEKTKLHHTTFLNGESNSMNMLDVLKNILQGLGCIIYQRDGNWCIIRPSDMTVSRTYTARRAYTWRDGSTTAENYLTTAKEASADSSGYTADTTFFQINSDTTMTLQYPVKKVVVNHKNDHNIMTSLTLDAVADTSSALFDEWDASGAGEAVVLVSDNLEKTQSSKVKGKCFIECDITNSQYCAASADAIYYPQSHDIIAEPSTEAIVDTTGIALFNGLYMSISYRPLGANLVTNEVARIQFSPRIIWDEGSAFDYLFATGAGGSFSDQSDASALLGHAFDDSDILDITDPFTSPVTKINEWKDIEVKTNRPAVNSEANQKIQLQMWLYGGFKYTDSNGDTESEPYTTVYDVSYQNIVVSFLISENQIVTEEQDYILESSANYSYVLDKETSIGSKLATGGKDTFIGFDSNVQFSWNHWTDGTFTGMTMQHLISSAYMMMYYKPIRRMDGTHYGNYKFGDVLSVDSGLNGSTGKFFPLSAEINFKKAQINISADDLMDNSALSVGQFTKKIKWIGKNNETYTETLS